MQLLSMLCAAATLLCVVPAEAGRMRFLSADNTPYNYNTPAPTTATVAPTPAPTTATLAPTQPMSTPSVAPYVPGSPAPTYGTLPPTPAPVPNQPTAVPASPSPVSSNYVSPTQCPGQFACAGAGGVSAFNGSVIAPQCHPYGTYVGSNGAAVTLNSQCIPMGNDAVSLNCPVQYDAPQSHGAGVQDYVCYVYDPYRKEQPWASSSAAYAQCYNPVEYSCTATNLLCPLTAPYACGRACFSASQYKCVVDSSNFFNSQLQSVSGAPGGTSICPAQPLNPSCPKPTTSGSQ